MLTRVFERHLVDDQVCVVPTDQSGSSTIACQGDSGGPLTQVLLSIFIKTLDLILVGFDAYCFTFIAYFLQQKFSLFAWYE